MFLGEPEPLNLSLNQEKGTNGGPEEREDRFSVLSESLHTNTQNTSHTCIYTGMQGNIGAQMTDIS